MIEDTFNAVSRSPLVLKQTPYALSCYMHFCSGIGWILPNSFKNETENIVWKSTLCPVHLIHFDIHLS
jgi:hypothetical protein